MNEHLAHQNGYHYCGPTCDKYCPRTSELESWNDAIAFAKKIKKEYVGADYVIATGTKDSWLGRYSKGLFGNEVFNKVWNLLKYNTFENRKDLIEKRKIVAEKEYKRALEQIAIDEKKYQDDLEFLNSIKK